MKQIFLLLRMLRYRVAIMLIMFFLLGVTAQRETIHYSNAFILAVISLLASYITATTVNDIADKKIDAINHAKNKGRPLVTGDATVKDLLTTHVIGLVVTLLTAALINMQGLLVMSISLAINYLYSVRPFRLSYRTFLAPVILAFAYVVIPYLLGLIVAGKTFTSFDMSFLVGLTVLFSGRILLKDFRDRKGDAAFGKPTMILKYGKTTTCITSLLFILVGNCLLFANLHVSVAILVLLQIIFCTIYFSEYKLWQTTSSHREQIMIGLGAKMGNGLLITILGIFIIQSYSGSIAYQTLFVLLQAGIYVGNFIALIRNPDQAVIGYKG